MIFTYTVAQYKPHKTACNEATATNVLDCEFEQTDVKRFVVSDSDVCESPKQVALHMRTRDLFNREIIGHNAG